MNSLNHYARSRQQVFDMLKHQATRTCNRCGGKCTRIIDSYSRLTGVTSITLPLLYPVSIVDVFGAKLVARRNFQAHEVTDMFRVKMMSIEVAGGTTEMVSARPSWKGLQGPQFFNETSLGRISYEICLLKRNRETVSDSLTLDICSYFLWSKIWVEWKYFNVWRWLVNLLKPSGFFVYHQV